MRAIWRTVGFVCACSAVTVVASEGTPADGEAPTIEEVVTIGTRGKPRAAVDTAVPVDVFSADEIASVNSSDLVDVITNIVPSFNVRRYAIADGATFVRPTELRGLDAHHTLVLIDGKRRHRSALMRLGEFGAHGPDIGSLPAIAISAVEVLRDGAAAQYGSDAIAGVMDFKLRRDDGGFELRARVGTYAAGDGDELTVEGNVGFPLGNGGFLNLSAQIADAAPTSRSEPYDLTIGGSGLTPAQAVASRLTVDGRTFYGPGRSPTATPTRVRYCKSCPAAMACRMTWIPATRTTSVMSAARARSAARRKSGGAHNASNNCWWQTPGCRSPRRWNSMGSQTTP